MRFVKWTIFIISSFLFYTIQSAGYMCENAEKLDECVEEILKCYRNECFVQEVQIGEDEEAEIPLPNGRFGSSFIARLKKLAAGSYFKRKCENEKDKYACFIAGIVYFSEFAFSDASYECMQKACDMGLGIGCLFQGFILSIRNREELTEDIKNLFKKACRKGILIGCMAEFIPIEGTGIKNKDAGINDLLKKCAKEKSCYKVGERMKEEWDADINVQMLFFEHGCKNGEVEGCVKVGRMYMEGYLEGGEMKRDIKKGEKYLRIACDKGAKEVCMELAERYLNGDVLEKNVKKGVGYLKLACKKGFAEGCFTLGMEYIIGEKVKKDLSEGERYLTLACEKGNVKACFEVGFRYFWSEREDEVKKGEMYLKIACERGEIKGCLELLHKYRGSGENSEDMKRLMGYLEEVCVNKNSEVCYHIGKMYILGDGVKRDTSGGWNYIWKACVKNENRVGYKRACDIINLERNILYEVEEENIIFP